MQHVLEKNRRFYDQYVAEMIRSQFSEYEDRIAVGIAGEGSDCFGYDDELSRDHDFGTGVCLWLTDADMARFGYALSIAYNELVEHAGCPPDDIQMPVRHRIERAGIKCLLHFSSRYA